MTKLTIADWRRLVHELIFEDFGAIEPCARWLDTHWGKYPLRAPTEEDWFRDEVAKYVDLNKLKKLIARYNRKRLPDITPADCLSILRVKENPVMLGNGERAADSFSRGLREFLWEEARRERAPKSLFADLPGLKWSEVSIVMYIDHDSTDNHKRSPSKMKVSARDRIEYIDHKKFTGTPRSTPGKEPNKYGRLWRALLAFAFATIRKCHGAGLQKAPAREAVLQKGELQEAKLNRKTVSDLRIHLECLITASGEPIKSCGKGAYRTEFKITYDRGEALEDKRFQEQHPVPYSD